MGRQMNEGKQKKMKKKKQGKTKMGCGVVEEGKEREIRKLGMNIDEGEGNEGEERE